MMNLLSIRIITANVKQLTDYYEKITGLKAVWYTQDFAELKTDAATLAFGSTKTLEVFGGDHIAKPAQNHTAIIEFISPNVDNDYDRIKQFIAPHLVQAPTTMPWGNRSLLFRDPDGNLINFFTPVTTQAVERSKGRIN
ncbi:VOC family protein [Sphingobacterium thalpophilum]|uniref:VOC family protein n=1 Tax=Sphingobacterium thalpophilum TaxID=259 RepID=UPI003C728B3A